MTLNISKGMGSGPAGFLRSFWLNRELIIQMTRREVVGRYRGSVMGLAWSFFNPILLLVVYTFVFSEVFQSRWAGQEGKGDFAILLFVGMIVHGLFAECANRAPSLILSNANYVKKVVFPLEILPLVSLGAALFHSCISVIVLLAAQQMLSGTTPLTALYFPVILLPLCLGTLGLSWLLAALGVFIRDVGQIISVLTTVLLFLSPVLYPVSALPEAYRPWLRLNPLTYVIEDSRNVLIFGHSPEWHGFILSLAGSVVIALAGFWLFQKTRAGFADVL